MTVDLSKAKAGDKVKFRCGGESEIASLGRGDQEYPASFRFLNASDCMQYTKEGKHCLYDAFDIIAIEPKPFDWDEVRPGMAFHGPIQDELIFYVGPDFGDRCKAAIFYCPKRADKDQWVHYSHLTRAPEHDIEPQ